MINSRSIDDLDPPARLVCIEHVRLCKEAGIEILVTSTYRDFAAQDDLYAIGRTKELQRAKVTNAKAGKSWHNYRCAWDVVPLIGGKTVWNDESLWNDVIRLGKQAGAEAGADWESFPDKPHFQVVPQPLNLDEARTRFVQHGTIFVA